MNDQVAIGRWTGWGDVIRQLRKINRFDQEMLGLILGEYTQKQISRYESEAEEPPLDFWVKLSKGFGLNLSWAFTGKGKPFNKEFQCSKAAKKVAHWQSLQQKVDDFLDGTIHE